MNKTDKSDSVKAYIKLQSRLQQEKIRIESRLRAIQTALGETRTAPASTSPAVRTARKAAPRKARKAAVAKAAKPVKKQKRQMSPEGRARISAAAKARWAKARAAGNKTLKGA